jgi:hypothetical protein
MCVYITAWEEDEDEEEAVLPLELTREITIC